MFDDQKAGLPVQTPVASRQPVVPAEPTLEDNQWPGENSPKPRGRGLKIALIAVVVLVVLALAGGAAAYYFLVLNGPEKIFSQAMENFNKLQSGSAAYQADVSVKADEQAQAAEAYMGFSPLSLLGQDFKFSLKLNSDFVKVNDFYKTSSVISIDLPVGPAMPLLGTATLSPKIYVTMTDKERIYFKVSGVPLAMLGGEQMESLNDQWIKLDLKEIEKQFGLRFDPVENEKQLAEFKKSQEEFIAIYQQNKFIKFVTLAEETIDNESSFHYRLEIDRPMLKKFFAAASTKVEEKLKAQNTSDTYRVDLQEQEAEIDKFLDSAKIKAEVWIGKKSRQFKKTVINIEYYDEVKKVTTTIDSTASLTRANEEIAVDEPTTAMSLEEAMKILYGDMQAKASDAKTIADIKQIQTALELYFNDQGQYPFPPVGGNILGIDAVQLSGSGGFTKEYNNSDSTMYMGLVPVGQGAGYRYNLCSPDKYIIDFDLVLDTSGLLAGKNFATPSGIDATTVVSDDCLDPDVDGLSNYFEKQYKTKSDNADSDGDGFYDGVEVASGYNPLGAGKLK